MPILKETNSVAKNNSIYFKRYDENASYWEKSDIYVSKKIDGIYTNPEKLNRNFSSDDARELAVAVSPDEKYMIIEVYKDDRTCELFISFRKDGSWTERTKLPISWGRFPSISPDGKYLFFMTRDGIYWVSTKIFEKLIPEELKWNPN